jgi:hypothetical protein
VNEPRITTTRWATSGSTQWGPITGEMRDLLRHFAPTAIERANEYGFDDRRESAWALLLAPVAPLLGLMFFSWSTGDALSVLLLNLLVGLADDVGKVLRAGASWVEIRQDAVRDAFVWRLATALQAGRVRLHVTSLPRPTDFADGYPMDLFWLALAAAFGVSGFCLLMLNGPGTLHASGVGIYIGVLPSLLLSLTLAWFHIKHRHPHWRRAGSVRLRSTTTTASFVAVVAAYPFTLLGAEVVPQSESSLDAATILPLLATLLWGGYKLHELSGMRRVARWLARQVTRAAVVEPDGVPANRAKIP